MPTEVKEVNTTVKATIDVEWEIAIQKAYGGGGHAETLKAETLKGGAVDVEEVGSAKCGVRNEDQRRLTSAATEEVKS